MRVERLRIDNLRILRSVELEPGPGVNLLLGANGAGKTSILEALHLLAYGRSFRAASRDLLIRQSCASLQVYAEVRAGTDARLRRLGLSSTSRDWEARVDGQTVAALSELLRCCPVVCFEPGSHALIGGGSELRRRFLDWGLFHVEPGFLTQWRRYQRALRQRNALLKTEPDAGTLDSWDRELAEAGAELHGLRQRHIDTLGDHLQPIAAALMPEVGAPLLRYSAGWRADRETLIEALRISRSRDRQSGHTSVGPHRANWQIGFRELPQREQFSRGQEKLAALACVLAQAAQLADAFGQPPIVALDDLGSELDAAHQEAAIDFVATSGAQVWISGTVEPSGIAVRRERPYLFHVEQGEVRRAL